MANLTIYSTKVNILSDDVTLKPFFKWVPKLARLCLITREKFSLLRSVKSCDIIQSCQKACLPNEKFQKSTLDPILHVSPSAIIDGATSNLKWRFLR